MRLKCPVHGGYDYLPNFPDTKPCPTCGAPGTTDMAVRGHGGFKPPKNYDLELSDPETLQFWQENKAHLEDMILSGDRAHETHDCIDAGPSALQPFGNDPTARRQAIAERGYSKDGAY